MRLVYVETPFAGDEAKNLAYLRACMLDCIRRGDAPFASHMMYTQILDDAVPSERLKGMSLGFAWATVADATVVYTNLGISQGMKRGIEMAEIQDRPIEYRELSDDWSSSSISRAIETAA